VNESIAISESTNKEARKTIEYQSLMTDLTKILKLYRTAFYNLLTMIQIDNLLAKTSITKAFRESYQ